VVVGGPLPPQSTTIPPHCGHSGFSVAWISTKIPPHYGA